MSVNLLADFLAANKNKVPAGLEQRFNDESLCRKCGACCYGSVHFHGRLIVIRELPCRFLTPVENGPSLCKVYDKRGKLARWCQKVSRSSVAKGCFPEDCPYVQGIRGYRGKNFLQGEEQKKFYEWLKGVFEGQPRPEYLRESDWKNFQVWLGLKPRQ